MAIFKHSTLKSSIFAFLNIVSYLKKNNIHIFKFVKLFYQFHRFTTLSLMAQFQSLNYLYVLPYGSIILYKL